MGGEEKVVPADGVSKYVCLIAQGWEREWGERTECRCFETEATFQSTTTTTE